MQEAARVHKPISFHEENPAYIQNNGVNAGKASEYFGIGGSDRQAEIDMVRRDLSIALETGAEIVIQHISENPRRGDTPSFHADGGRRDGTRYDGEDEPAASHGS